MADNKYIYCDGNRWIVRIPNLRIKSFSFAKFAGKEVALESAIAWRNQKLLELTPPAELTPPELTPPEIAKKLIELAFSLLIKKI